MNFRKDKKKFTKYARSMNPRNLVYPKRGGIRF